MNHKTICILLAFLVAGIASKLNAQGTAFMYQGHVDTNGAPANGPFDFQFTLFDNVTGGNQVAGPETNFQVTVTSGLFNTTIDFGPVFTGSNYWIAIGVRTNNGPLSTNTFTLLTPRQPILPVPYAIFATSASNLLGTLSATQLSGALPSAQITGTYSGMVNFTNATNSFTGTYFGNGVNLTNLNGSQITSGTVPDSSLATNVAFLNSNQQFGAVNTFTNRNNSFTGSFFGNGLVGWVPVTTTFTQAVANTGYILLNSNRTTVLLPPTNSLFVGDVVRVSAPESGGWAAEGNVGESIQGVFSSYSNSVWLAAAIPTAGSWDCMAAAASGAPMFAGGLIGSGGVYQSGNNGATWSLTGASGTSFAGMACSANGQIVYAAPNPATIGGSAKIQCSTNGGLNWTTIMQGGNWTSIACSGDGTKFIAAVTNGANSAIYTSATSGASSNKVTSIPTGVPWVKVTSSSDGSRMAAAQYAGDIYYALNGTWTDSHRAGRWSAMASSADGMRLAAAAITNGTGGTIYISGDGGATWSMTPVLNGFWNCLAMSADGSRIIAGLSGLTLYSSVDFGSTWNTQNTTNAIWGAVACSADGQKVAAGDSNTGGGIYYSGISPQYITTSNTNNPVGGGQGSAVELQYIGNGQFMPVSSMGNIWLN